MAQPDAIEIDLTPARRNVKRAMRELDEANKELARMEERLAYVEQRLASEFGISIIKEKA